MQKRTVLTFTVPNCIVGRVQFCCILGQLQRSFAAFIALKNRSQVIINVFNWGKIKICTITADRNMKFRTASNSWAVYLKSPNSNTNLSSITTIEKVTGKGCFRILDWRHPDIPQPKLDTQGFVHSNCLKNNENGCKIRSILELSDVHFPEIICRNHPWDSTIPPCG